MKRISIFALLVGAVIVLRTLSVRPDDAAHYRPNEQVAFLTAGSALLLFGLRNFFFNSNPGDSRDIRWWKLVGITYSVVAVWISMVPIFLFLTEPRYSAAVGMPGRILTFAGLVVSFLSVFGWRLSRRILPIVSHKRTRTYIGIAGCLFGPAAVIVWFSIAQQVHYSIGVILLTWTWAVMAILGGVGYGLTEAARRQTKPALA